MNKRMNKRTLAALLGSVSLAAMLAGHTARADDITLHALMEDVPETHIIEAMLPDFTKATGIKVEFQKLVYSDMHQKLVTQLIGNASYYNVLEVDFLWAGEFPEAGWLADLKPFVDKSSFDLKPFIPSMMDMVGMHKGTLYMIPMYNYSMGILYRTDLLNDPKLKDAYKQATGKDLAPPTSLAEYVEISKFMNKNAGVAGSAMQSQRGDPNSMEFSNYLFANGGKYLDDSGKVALNSPEAVKALELYVDNIQNGAQKGALSATLDDTFRLMCDGKAWSMVTYWWMLPQVDNKDSCPNAAGKLALSVMPGGHGESGGWGWAIPKNESPELQDAAWKFISWVQSKETSVGRAMQGHAPTRSDVYQDQGVLAKYPYYKQALDVVASGEAFPIFTYSAQYEDVLGRQLSLAGSGDAKPADAIKAAADGLDELLKKSQ
ncbi:MAG TPA: extracellular solute-binding protein [Candidatus Cybelea sp.]|nr:extracellular solute-binding protein [Candidatus Cybelea sp.]